MRDLRTDAHAPGLPRSSAATPPAPLGGAADRPLGRALAAAALGILLAAAPGCAAGEGTEAPASASGRIALVGATLLDPGATAPPRAATVVVEGERIVAVGAAGDVAPEGVRRVDASGLHLLPGLWDLHVHLTLVDDAAPPLFVTQGVTGVRDMGAVLEEIDALRARIRSGELLGPRIVRAGPTLNGAKVGPHHRLIEDAKAAREAVADLDAAGVDLLKTHNQTSREAYFALLEAAAEHDLVVGGHVPMTVSPVEACEAGQRSVEHIATIFEGTYLARFEGELEAFQAVPGWLEEEAGELVSCFAGHDTLFVPTLVAYDVRAHWAAWHDDPDPRLRYLSPELREAWMAREPTEVDRREDVIELRESLVGVGRELARRLQGAGAPLGTGTDAGAPGLLPGFSLHDEVELLVEAGLTPRQALAAAVRGPGPEAGGDPLQGRLVPGAPADLVLLREDAFESVAALEAIEAVMVAGRHLPREELDRVLAELAGGGTAPPDPTPAVATDTR